MKIAYSIVCTDREGDMRNYDRIIRMIEGEFVTFASARRYAMNLGFEISEDGKRAVRDNDKFSLVVSDDQIAHWVREY